MNDVTLYEGNTLRAIANRILADLKKSDRGRHVLLVPDRDTLAMEETLTERFGVTVDVDVLTFARLAVMVLGNAAWDCLTPEGCTMLLTKALYGVKDQLTYFRTACALPGFANEMYSALVAIRENGISVEVLEAAADKMKGRTKDKAKDIAVIYREYLAVLASRLDPTTRLEKLVKAIPDSPEIAACNFYILDFYSFNHMQYEVIAALMNHAKSVKIGYISEKVGKHNRRIYPDYLRGKLTAIAHACGYNSQPKRVEEPLTSTYKQAIQDSLFGYTDEGPVDADPNFEVKLFRAKDTMDELRTVCTEICRLVRDKHYRYRDIAIVCAEGEMYDDVFRAVFDEYKVPFFRDSKVLLSGEPVVRFILDSLDCRRRDFEFDSVMKVVKNTFFSEPQADVHYFENYCLKFNINYSRFKQTFTLAEQQHGQKVDDVERAEKVRLALMNAIITVPTSKEVKKSRVGDFVDAINTFLADYDINEKFAKFKKEQKDKDFLEGAKRSEQVPKRLRDMLALMKKLLPDEEVTLDDFIMLLQSSLDSVHISLLPQSSDCVYIGEAKDSRYDRVRAMFVIGATDGVLPEVPQAGSIISDSFFGALQEQKVVRAVPPAGTALTDAFFKALQKEQVVVYPSAKDEERYAMFYLEQLLLIPTERLYVSYCGRSADNAKQYPSMLIDSLSELFGIAVTDGLMHHTVEMQAANPHNAYKVMLRMGKSLRPEAVDELRKWLSADDAKKYADLSKEGKEVLPDTLGLFFNADKRAKSVAGGRYLTSISQLETYFACPYQHFVKYGLRASERQEDVMDVRETGDLLHKVLELVMKRLYGEAYRSPVADRQAMRHAIEHMSDEEVDAVTKVCLDEVLQSARYEGLNVSERKVQLDRIRREAYIVVRREMALAKISEFKPCEFEVKFNDGGDYDAIAMDDQIYLTGKIDRIDRRDAKEPGEKDEYLVIDYKTGSVHIELSSVYYGTKVQIYAYLGALRNENNVPIGAFYKKIAGAYEKEDSPSPAGALLGHPPKDEAKLREIDTTFEPRVPGKMVTGGEVLYRGKYVWKNRDPDGVLLEEGDLDLIIDYVMDLMRGAVEEIRGGNIDASPLDKYTCEKCAARNICDNVARDVRENKKVDITSFGTKK